VTELEGRGIKFDLYLSDRAHLILPYHRILDGIEEEVRAGNKVGTTGRGIGPCYQDKAARTGIRAGDLLHPERLRTKVMEQVALKTGILRAYGRDDVLDAEAMLEELDVATVVLRPFIVDTVQLLHESVKAGDNILLEGAQGVMLDLDHGTYPYVTSSYVASGGMCIGSGLSPRDIGDVVGVVKAYTTRVGEGPFPTELDTETGVGHHLAHVGHEVGTTTGRPRRCGWLDLVVVNQSVRLCGINQLALTKLDVLCGMDEILVCHAYELPDGTRITNVPSDPDLFAQAQPVYETFEGWSNLGDGTWEGLPTEARVYLQFIREKTGAQIKMVGIGPKRDETIVRQ
jgi:adenylosuccinate synthase